MSLSASAKIMPARVLSDRSGAVAVEFGIIGLVFFILLLGAVDLGRYQITLQSLRDISAGASRVALLDRGQVASVVGAGGSATNKSDTALKAAVTSPTNLTPFLPPASLTIVTSEPTSLTGVRTITVTATYPFSFLAPLLPGGPITLSDSTALSY